MRGLITYRSKRTGNENRLRALTETCARKKY